MESRIKKTGKTERIEWPKNLSPFFEPIPGEDLLTEDKKKSYDFFLKETFPKLLDLYFPLQLGNSNNEALLEVSNYRIEEPTLTEQEARIKKVTLNKKIFLTWSLKWNLHEVQFQPESDDFEKSLRIWIEQSFRIKKFSLKKEKNYDPEEWTARAENLKIVIGILPTRVEGRWTVKFYYEQQKELPFCQIPEMNERGEIKSIRGHRKVIIFQSIRAPNAYFFKEGPGILYGEIIPFKGPWVKISLGSLNSKVKSGEEKKNKQVIKIKFLNTGSTFDLIQILNEFPVGKQNFLELFGDEELVKDSLQLDKPKNDTESKIPKILFNKDNSYFVFDKLGRQKFDNKMNFLNRINGQKLAIDLKDNSNKLIFSKGTILEETQIKILEELVKKNKIPSYSLNGYEFYLIKFFSPKYPQKIINVFSAKRLDADKTYFDFDDLLVFVSYFLNLQHGLGEIKEERDKDSLDNQLIQKPSDLLYKLIENTLGVFRKAIEKSYIATISQLKTDPFKFPKLQEFDNRIKKFFHLSSLVQMQDQTNPLAEAYKARRVSSLGLGGHNLTNSGLSSRDNDPSYFNRIDMLGTPEGSQTGLKKVLNLNTIIDKYGQILVPCFLVEKGVIKSINGKPEIKYLSTIEEKNVYIASFDNKVDKNNFLVEEKIWARHRGKFVLVEREKINFIDSSEYHSNSLSAIAPCIGNNDATRMLVAQNVKQSLIIKKPEAPLVSTGIEPLLFSNSSLVIKANSEEEVNYVDSKKIVTNKQEYPLNPFFVSNTGAIISSIPLVKVGEKVKKGQIIAGGNYQDNHELALGRNLMAAFMCFDGQNFEDAFVIRKGIIKEEIFDTLIGEEHIIVRKIVKINKKKEAEEFYPRPELKNLDSEGIIKVGSRVRVNDILVSKRTPYKKKEAEELLYASISGEKVHGFEDTSYRLPQGKKEGIVYSVERQKAKDIYKRDSAAYNPSNLEIVKILIYQKRGLEVGDKITNRFGNKGIVGKIVEDVDMPYYNDEERKGRIPDIIFNPLSIQRMNIGQLIEGLLGLIALRSKKKILVRPFNTPSWKLITKLLEENKIENHGLKKLYDGRTGHPFDKKVFVAPIYCVLLDHKVSDKIHSRWIGPRTTIHEAPPKGRKKGGQRLGEMEVWAMQAYNVAHKLLLSMGAESDDKKARKEYLQDLIFGEGKYETKSNNSESFNILIQYLRAIGFDLTAYDYQDKIINFYDQFSKNFRPIIKYLKINYLTNKRILELSFGKVENSETLDNNFEPKEGGLFCPRVFGPWKNYQCACKDLQSHLIRNQKCDDCGVLIAHSEIRRWRMGHIELSHPVVNTLILKNILPQIEQLLKIPGKQIKNLIYYRCYIALDNGGYSTLKNKQILSQEATEFKLIDDLLKEIIAKEESKENSKLLKEAKSLSDTLSKQLERESLQKEVEELKKKGKNASQKEANQLLNKRKQLEKVKLEVVFLKDDYFNFFRKCKIRIETGSLAIRELLSSLNLKKELENELANPNALDSESNRSKVIFLRSLVQNEVPLEGLVLDYLPVIPAGLRPATKLEDNSIATTQINNFYRKVIIINERLKSIIEINKKSKTEVLFKEIRDNEQRSLQTSVDQLIYGGETIKKVNDSNKSLIEHIVGKEGIFRKWSLGKRVDFSARSVAAAGPHLLPDEAGIPVEMALILFRPSLLNFLIKEGKSLIEAKKLIMENDPSVFSILNKVIENSLVMVNRAPTLHRLGFRAFKPVLIPEKVIRIPPFTNQSYNLDFDGDTVSVHSVNTVKTKEEIRKRMMSSQNILDPKNNSLIATPRQEMILGIYYLTKIDEDYQKNPPVYYDLSQIDKDYEFGRLSIGNPLIIPLSLMNKNFVKEHNDQFILTTFGRLKFNQTLPASFPYYINDLNYYNNFQTSPAKEDIINSPLFFKKVAKLKETSGWKKEELIPFLNHLSRLISQEEMINFLNELKKLAFYSATQSGISISLFELSILEEKSVILKNSQEKLDKLEEYNKEGFYSLEDFSREKNKIWDECKKQIKEILVNKLKAKKNSLYYILDSGARLSGENLTQIFGMRGQMMDYKGNLMEPIFSSLKEGLSPFEFFKTLYNTMKGMTDLTFKTAKAGYFARQLVEAVQDVIINQKDCQTKEGTWFEIKDKNIMEEIRGCCLTEDVLSQKGEQILESGTLLLGKELKMLKENSISKIKVRSPLGCSLIKGICQKCYGLDLGKNNQLIEEGSTVGIVAAQSLSEPGTQLTMRTLHGAGETDDITRGLPEIETVLHNVTPEKKERAVLAKEDGEIIEIIDDEKANLTIKQKFNNREISYHIDRGKLIQVEKGQKIEKGQILTSGKVDLEELLLIAGREKCQDYIEKTILGVYLRHGITINPKHVRIFTRKMLNQVEITNSGESEYLLGDIINYQEFLIVNEDLIKNQKKPLQVKYRVSGLKQIVHYCSSFLASASFQDTLKSLIYHICYNPRPNNSLFTNHNIHRLGVGGDLKGSLIAGQLAPIGDGYWEQLERKNYKGKKKRISSKL